YSLAHRESQGMLRVYGGERRIDIKMYKTRNHYLYRYISKSNNKASKLVAVAGNYLHLLESKASVFLGSLFKINDKYISNMFYPIYYLLSVIWSSMKPSWGYDIIESKYFNSLSYLEFDGSLYSIPLNHTQYLLSEYTDLNFEKFTHVKGGMHKVSHMFICFEGRCVTDSLSQERMKRFHAITDKIKHSDYE
ncbi:hypothetical protein, partial [Synechococcus sp. MU1655]|uniref:hypothetical protein n=1 Tax=Synechococcus sp. MU1655 TaxID=2508355 RepID=UPI0020271DC3